jgi:hypothetical protein
VEVDDLRNSHFMVTRSLLRIGSKHDANAGLYRVVREFQNICHGLILGMRSGLATKDQQQA